MSCRQATKRPTAATGSSPQAGDWRRGRCRRRRTPPNRSRISCEVSPRHRRSPARGAGHRPAIAGPPNRRTGSRCRAPGRAGRPDRGKPGRRSHVASRAACPSPRGIARPPNARVLFSACHTVSPCRTRTRSVIAPPFSCMRREGGAEPATTLDLVDEAHVRGVEAPGRPGARVDVPECAPSRRRRRPGLCPGWPREPPSPARAPSSRESNGTPEDVGPSWHQYSLRVAPPVRTRSRRSGRPGGAGSRSRAARCSRCPARRREPVSLGAVAPSAKPWAAGATNGNRSPPRRAGRRASLRFVGGGCATSSSRSRPAKSREIRPAPVLDAPPGSQSPFGARCE